MPFLETELNDAQDCSAPKLTVKLYVRPHACLATIGKVESDE